jgi:hypothetical protein
MKEGEANIWIEPAWSAMHWAAVGVDDLAVETDTEVEPADASAIERLLVDDSPADASSGGESRDGYAQVRLICGSASRLDLHAARYSRWTDTVDPLNGRAPEYLLPFLAYAEG